MLNSFTVKNYRSFEQEAKIELRPITLLLGKNSSGKSSLTRLIPLLQQSIDKRTASPILWTSDVVDFGDISNVITDAKQDCAVQISLEIDAKKYHQYVASKSPYYFYAPTSAGNLNSIKFTARLIPDNGRTKYHSTQIEFDGNVAEIEWATKAISSIKVNGSIIEDYNSANAFADTTSLFPEIIFRNSVPKISSHNVGAQFAYITAQMTYPGLVSALDYFINKKTGQEKRAQIRRSLVYSSPDNIKDYVRTLDNIVKSKLAHEEALLNLSQALFINDISKIISYVGSQLQPFLESASYLGPSRASGARFYRYQELSVDRIDSRGDNLPMYLSSLSANELNSFNEIMEAASGFRVEIRRTPGHASIEVGKAGDARYENIADVGFGFSQFLPIIAQIHAAGLRRSHRGALNPAILNVREPIIAVEQPELHLHPALQAGLGDLFVAAVHNREGKLNGRKFLIETHSESLIARLSTLVTSGSIKSENIIIYFVEKDDETKHSTVRVGGFLKDGTISNWPIGFLSSSVI